MDIAAQLIASGTYVPEGSGETQQPESGVTQTTNKAILGITVQTIDPQSAYQYNMMPGVYVSDITVQSTKDAGLEIGDRIVSVDDVAVSQGTDVTGYLAEKNVGDVVNLTVARNGKMLTLASRWWQIPRFSKKRRKQHKNKQKHRESGAFLLTH